MVKYNEIILSEEIGVSVVKGTRLTIPFTHQNLADMISATRVTVTRLIGNFKSRELICIDRDRHIIIKAD